MQLLGRTILCIIASVTVTTAHAQGGEEEGLVLLARTYKNMMFRNDPGKDVLAQLANTVPSEVSQARDFIVQTITPKNDLLEVRYLRIPDERVLWQICTIRELSEDMREENRIGDQALIDSLRRSPPSRCMLVHTYYAMLFSAVGNKNQPFNLGKFDMRPDAYGLKDDTERGIVFLECMDLCRSVIWGYMNIVKPPNTSRAGENIARYPKVNGAPYYQFNDLAFPDFQFMYDDSVQSYKGIMVDHYMELLLYHFAVLKGEGAKETGLNDLLLGSAMREESLYKYTRHRSTFEAIFLKQKSSKY